jgi:NTP pyrophosphatase (non-canonical NTP hydrolase)
LLFSAPIVKMARMKTGMIKDTIGMIRLANVGRNKSNINRRFHKFFEEFGELEQAYLSVSSSNNHRAMTASHVREEATDVLIVAVDVALTVIDETQERHVPDEEMIALVSSPRRTEQRDYDDITMDMVSDMSQYGKLNRRRPAQAVYFAYGAVTLAYELADLVFDGDEEGFRHEVIRKLMKWQANRRDGKVVTDAE